MEHERKLLDALERAKTTELELESVRRKLVNLQAQLEDSEAILRLAQGARLELEKRSTLRDEQIVDLRTRLSKIAAESGITTRDLNMKLVASEAARKADIMRREVEVAVLQGVIEAAEQRHEKDMQRLPDLQQQRAVLEIERLGGMRRELEDEKLDIRRYRMILEENNAVREKRLEEARLRTTHQSNQELTAVRADLDACRLIGDEANRREKERLACLRSVLHSERASIVRDRSALDAERSNLVADRAEFYAMRATLEPRFKDARMVEYRAAQREKAATKAEDDARTAASELRLDKFDLDKREAAAGEAQQIAEIANQRADQIVRLAYTQVARSRQQTLEVERSRFILSRQQAALARQIVAARRAVSSAKRHLANQYSAYSCLRRPQPQFIS